MKRIVLAVLLILVVVAFAPAQDLQLLGQDFDVFVNGLGSELLPGLSQAAIWGQFPGTATIPGDSTFFVTLSIGTLFTDGVFGFAETADFAVLDMPGVIGDQLSGIGAGNSYDTLQNFFPLPILRIAGGFKLSEDTEFMLDLSGFPGFVANVAGNVSDSLDGLELSAFHIGSKVRHALVDEVGAIPSISVGGGYTFSAFRLGFPLGAIGTPVGNYGSTTIGSGWTLYLKGDLGIASTIHSFGVDLQTSKQFGSFVPFLGVSPYYQIASFNGNIGGADADSNEFDAYIDYNNGDPVQDVVYNGLAPIAAWVDNDLSILLTGGFDILFGADENFVLEIHGAWSIGDGSPGARIGFRFQ